MSDLVVKFNTDNLAFGTSKSEALQEASVVLHDVAHELFKLRSDGVIRDANGNSIGTWEWTR